MQHNASNGEVFLQNKFLGMAFNSSGTLGSAGTAPKGFVTDALNGYIRLGLIADTDGFGTGKAAARDGMLGGLPVEGFSLGYKAGGKTVVATNMERIGLTDIKGSSTDLSSGSTAATGWSGTTAQKIAVNQVVTMSDDAKFMRFEVTLTNNSTATVDDLRYMRTVDPDHGSTFTTVNKVIEQGGDGANGALIAAYASGTSTPMFYYTGDDRARVSSYGLDDHDPFADAGYKSAQSEGFSETADKTMHINFGLGPLAAGQSTTVVFYLGITDDLNATLAAIKASDTAPAPAPIEVPNVAPEAHNDTASVVAGGKVTGNVLANDRDADGDALTATLVSGAKHGSVTLKADGSFSFIADKGWSGVDSFSYAASDGDASASATVQVTVAPPPNTAAVAVADVFATVGTAAVTGNVLSNDSDADGDALTASLISGPTHGSVTLAADGSFRFVAESGFAGTDTFTYQASDGQAGSTSTVTVSVAAPAPVPAPAPAPAPAPTALARALVQHGTDSGNQTMAATAGRDTFYFDSNKVTGSDKIVGFGATDLLATSRQLHDGNGDGIIAFSKNKLSLDAPGTTDMVTINGVSSLRGLGQDADGTWLYANASVRPKSALEGVLGNQTLNGDVADKKGQAFFFDTALDLDLGHDQIARFGAKDIIVTTVALTDGAPKDKIAVGDQLDLHSANGDWSLGSVDITGVDGSAVTNLEFDGAVKHAGTTYYVYSLAGSAADVAALSF